MAIQINVSTEDFLRGEAVDKAQWLPLQVIDVGEALAKDGESTNYSVVVKVISGEFSGKEITIIFSEKGPGMAQLGKFISACLNQQFGRKNPIKNFTLDSLKGKRLMGFDKPREWESRILDAIVDYKPFEGPQTSAPPAGATTIPQQA